MVPRIESAEVLSFRLKVPRTLVEVLPERLAGAGLKLSVSVEDNDLLLSVVEGDSSLRFKSIGKDVVLTDIQLYQDVRGAFFQKVLGPLVVGFGGDLHVRLQWNTAERNSHGDYAEVKVARGSTTYPGLASSAALSPSGGEVAGAPSRGVRPGAPRSEAPAEFEEDPAEDGAMEAERSEVSLLLERARAHWAEYQRLKKARGG